MEIYKYNSLNEYILQYLWVLQLIDSRHQIMIFQETDGAEEKFKLLTYNDLRPVKNKPDNKIKDKSSPLMLFAYLGEEGIEIHSKPLDMLFVEPKIVTTINFDEVVIAINLSKAQSSIYALGIKNDKQKLIFAMKFQKQSELNQFHALFMDALDQDRKARKTQFNYYPIEENLRKIIETIILKSRTKWELYKQLMNKLNQRSKTLNPNQNKLVILSLVGQDTQMEIALRKQKIQAYSLQKKQYISELKEDPSNIDIQEPKDIQNYSFRRKMDGVVAVNNEDMQEEGEIQLEKNFEDMLCLDKIPDYNELKIDGQFKNNEMEMDIEQPKRKDRIPEKIIAEKMMIPKKSYSIIRKQEIREEKRKIKPPEVLNFRLQKAIQAVKLLYQMMKLNSYELEKTINLHDRTGPLAEVLDEVKNILTQIQKQFQRDKPQNKYIPEFMRQASNNFMQYKKFKFKFNQ